MDEYYATFNQKRRKEIKRQTRVMLEQFGAEVEVHTSPEQVVANLDSLIRLHTSRWQSDDQTGNMVRPGFAPFMYRVCGHPPAGATPRLFVMKHEQKPVGGLLVFHCGQNALAYSIGRDPHCAISHLSPGFALLVWSIKDAIEQGMRYYDFLRGDERHKTHLTKSARKTVTLLVGRSANARLYLQALRAKDTFKSRFPKWWDRINGPASRQPSPPPGEAAERELEGERATV
jgi:CelD/BcsL family acetyltransferase involved in cellulose biosynthesis